MEQLLTRKMARGRTYYLVLWHWQGHASAADSWEPAEHLANCQERVAEYEAAASRRPKALRAHQSAGPAHAAAPPPPPAAARTRPHNPRPADAVAAAGPPGLGSVLLYWWSDDSEGWQLGRIRRGWLPAGPATGRRPQRRYGAGPPGEVDTLLDPATYGSCWISLTQAAPSRAS